MSRLTKVRTVTLSLDMLNAVEACKKGTKQFEQVFGDEETERLLGQIFPWSYVRGGQQTV